MKFNVQKCTSMSVHQLQSRFQDFTYKMNNDTLTRTNEQTYLGVMLTSDLKWNSHISNIAAEANRSLGLVKRSLHICKTDTKCLAYVSRVTSHLEHESSAWDPYTELSKHKLESVQHRAARFVARNYDWSKPGKVIVQELGWIKLEQRRKEHRLKLMFKVESGQSGLNM